MLKKSWLKNYIRHNGQRCPICDHNDLHGGSVNVDSGQVSQAILCPNCSSQWTNVYTLSNVVDMSAVSTVMPIKARRKK